MQNRRLQNLKEKTLSYKFDVVHVPGKQNLGPDATSRYPTGAPNRLILPGEPPETDLGHDCTTTTELRAMLIAGMAITDSPDTHADTDIGLVTAASYKLDYLDRDVAMPPMSTEKFRNYSVLSTMGLKLMREKSPQPCAPTTHTVLPYMSWTVWPC